MKMKIDFVTNSSSTSYMIMNRSSEPKTLVDFVKENPQLIEDYVETYNWNTKETHNQKNLIKSALENNIKFKPHENKFCIFGDEDGTLIGEVFDYILREGGVSKTFSWDFHSFLR